MLSKNGCNRYTAMTGITLLGAEIGTFNAYDAEAYWVR